MEHDPLTLLIGALCGASVFMLVWLIAKLGDALIAFTRAANEGFVVRVKAPCETSRVKKR